MRDEQKQRFIQWIKPVGEVLLLGGAYLLFIKLTGLAVPCLIRLATGKYCPGCGITRMALAYLRLDFRDAFHANPFLFFVVPLLLVYGLVRGIIFIKKGTNKYSIPEQVGLVLILIATIVFGILRNMERFAFLAPV